MIYLDLDIETIDLVEDLWWVFYLKEIANLETCQDLVHVFSEYGLQLVDEQVSDPDFQVILHDEKSNIHFDVFNSTETSHFTLECMPNMSFLLSHQRHV